MALLAAYVTILFGLDQLESRGEPVMPFAIALTMAVTLVFWRRGCALPAEER